MDFLVTVDVQASTELPRRDKKIVRKERKWILLIGFV
jgi:hypothetical protein